MFLTDSPKDKTIRGSQTWMAKAVTLLVISVSLLWFAEDFSPIHIFQPESSGWVLWMSYAKDLILPFAFYLFLCLGERWLTAWRVRALLAFAIPTLLEFGQLLYYQIASGPYVSYVGSFDPLDILMYAIGVGLAVILEQRLFPRVFRFW